MRALPDFDARKTALTAIDRTLLVEAGAGSGKTSVMAGRVVVLFASGVAPKHIAAITFTEFAASELLARIERFAASLAKGVVPRDLELAFPDGISAEPRANVEAAYKALDELKCTTIHGFAQALIKPYPAEAGIDPGAEIIDPAEADLAFQERYEAWLRARLSRATADGLIAELVLADETAALALISEVAQFLRRNRDARPAGAPWSDGALGKFSASADSFEKSLGGLDYCEERTRAACSIFLGLAENLGAGPLGETIPGNAALLGVAQLPRHESCFKQDGKRRKLQTKGKWEAAAAAAGRSKAEGKRAYDGLVGHYESCHDALEELEAAAAAELLVRLAREMDDLLRDWREYKRAAALLDFDDLLYTARDLLAGHEQVRQALANRIRYVLVDEFQDTDPLQLEILWLLCGEKREGADGTPLARVLRPGALFLVGDPKQAIYRFRGADVRAYLAARSAIGEGAIVKITANFRSVEPIIAFVNGRFETVLSEAAGQPGFAALAAIHQANDGACTVAALDIAAGGDNASAAAIRDAEANRIAELCARLVGNFPVRDQDTGERRCCRFGDIALLAPVGTELWRFEEALEGRGIPVSTQAGKGFFRRQEIQDLIALTRVLADARDTLALGALLRGPLVGLTEEELLDIAYRIPADPDRPERIVYLNLRIDSAHVAHDVARSVLEALQSLWRRARTTTPYALLADAVAELGVRPQLRQRFNGGSERALANVDLFLEMSRAYDVRGLRAFARDMRANWSEAVRQVEGRPDAEKESVTLITVHAAKGLEWPIVIPVNMTGTPKSDFGLLQDRRSNLFSVPLLGVEPSGYDAIRNWNEQEHARERVRLWYVATTRARDLLILPRHSAQLPDRCWAKIVDFQLGALDALDPPTLGEESAATVDGRENGQTREIFAAQAKTIVDATRKIAWARPSRDEIVASPEPASIPVFQSQDEADASGETEAPVVAGGSDRGTLLHKLLEEVLLGQIGDDVPDLERRAIELMAQLSIAPAADPASGISPRELAATVTRTLGLVAITQIRARLVPEFSVFGSLEENEGEVLISGVADAIAPDDAGNIEAVVDWKSDVEPSPAVVTKYRSQIGEYRRQAGARRGLLVFLTTGEVVEAT